MQICARELCTFPAPFWIVHACKLSSFHCSLAEGNKGANHSLHLEKAIDHPQSRCTSAWPHRPRRRKADSKAQWVLWGQSLSVCLSCSPFTGSDRWEWSREVPGLCGQRTQDRAQRWGQGGSCISSNEKFTSHATNAASAGPLAFVPLFVCV